MSYIQNNLQAGEEIKYKADIHWYIFAYPVILLLLSVFFSSAQTGFFHYVSLFLLLSGLFQLIKRILLKMGTICCHKQESHSKIRYFKPGCP